RPEKPPATPAGWLARARLSAAAASRAGRNRAGPIGKVQLHRKPIGENLVAKARSAFPANLLEDDQLLVSIPPVENPSLWDRSLVAFSVVGGDQSDLADDVPVELVKFFGRDPQLTMDPRAD